MAFRARTAQIGILLTLGFCVLAPLSDAYGKVLSQVIWVPYLVWFRFTVQVVMSAPMAWVMDEPPKHSIRLHFWLMARSAAHVAGIWAMISALRIMPIADAITIAYVLPFMVLILSAIMLGEQIDRYKVLACCLGFSGMVLVLRPNLELGWASVLPLFVAFFFAVFMLITRQISEKIGTFTMQSWGGIYALLLLSPLIAVFDRSHTFSPIVSNNTLIFALLKMGVFGTLAHWSLVAALKFLPASTVAPMQYLELPVAVLIGWFWFEDWPEGQVFLGLGLITAAGVYAIRRESRTVPPA